MTIQRTPNPWSCLAASFASCLNLTTNELCKLIGHDGSQILWPGLPEPQKRRSFHPQEMIDVALRLGHTVTPIEARPLFQVRGTPERFEVEFPDGVAYRLNEHLNRGSGVLTGLNLASRPHAVVWKDGMIHDPSGRMTSEGWAAYSYELWLFQIETFWMISRAE